MILLEIYSFQCYNKYMKNLLASQYLLPLSVTAGVIIIIIIIYLLFKKRGPRYVVKERLMSVTEYEYFKIINSFFGDEYLILPQINLASVIDKVGDGYRTELFRNVDFGIFDYNYRPILLIEINDNTHFRKDRIERDKKVNEICKKAKLPLITFWTKDGIDNDKIFKTLSKYL